MTLTKRKVLHQINKYPKSFYDFSDGVDLSDQEILKYLNEVANDLLENESQDFSYIATGNTIVIGFKITDKTEQSYQFVVSKKYSENTITIEKNQINHQIKHVVENDVKRFFQNI